MTLRHLVTAKHLADSTVSILARVDKSADLFMPGHYIILSDLNLVLQTFTGTVTAKCVLEVIDNSEEDEDYRDGMLELADWRDVTDLQITSDELSSLVDLTNGLSHRRSIVTRRAIVATSEIVCTTFRTAKRQVRANENLVEKLFSNVDSACDFLGLSKSQISRLLPINMLRTNGKAGGWSTTS